MQGNTSQNNRNNVPSQRDVSAIVSAIVENTTYTNNVLNSVFASISKIADAKKITDVKMSDVQRVEQMVVNYKNMINNIVNVLCQDDNGQARDLHTLLGAVRDENKSDNNKVVLKYKTIDAALQIPKVIESMFGVFDKISEQTLGFKSLIKFRINIWKLKPIISGLFKDLLNVFTSINPNKEMAEIVKHLVKQPDIIEQNNEILQTGEFNKSDTSKTITRQGQLGILDVFAKTFEIINSLNTLKVPKFTTLKKKLIVMRIALKMILSDIIKFYDKNLDLEKSDAQIKLMYIEDALIGRENRKGIREGGLQSIIQAMIGIFSLAKRMKFNLASIVMIRISLWALGGIIDVILKMQPQFESLGNKTINDNITNASKTMDKLVAIFKSLISIAALSLIVIISVVPIMIAMACIAGIIWSIKLIVTTMEKAAINEKSIEPLLDITQTLKKIVLNILLVGALALPGIIAMVAVVLFVAGLWLFTLIMKSLTMILEVVAESATRNLKKVLLMLAALIMVGVTILVFALAAPVIMEALTGNIIPFIISLAIGIGILALLMWVTAKLAKSAVDDAIKLGISMLIILGVLMLTALTLLMLEGIANRLSLQSYLNIGALLLGIIGLLATMVALGMALTFAQPWILISMGTIGTAVALLMLVLGAAVAVDKLAKIKIDFGSYKAPSGDGKIGTGTGAYGNMRMVIDFIKSIRESVKSLRDGGGREFRQGKRALRRTKRVINTIVKIAKRLEKLSKIKLDKELILSNVSDVFVFVMDLEKHINTFMNPNASVLGENASISEKLLAAAKDEAYRKKRNADLKDSNKTLNRVEKVVGSIVDIAEGIEYIGKVKIDQELVINNLKNIFAFVAQLEVELRNNLLADNLSYTDENGKVVSVEVLSKRELRKSDKKLNKVESIISTMQNIVDALNAIKDIKLDNEALKQIKNNVKIMFGAIGHINVMIRDNMDALETDADDITDTVTPAINCLTELNKVVNEFAKVNVSGLDKSVVSINKLINTISSSEASKSTGAAWLFSQLSKFSNTIKDLDATSVNNLIPVIDHVIKFNDSIGEFADIDNTKIDKNIESYVKFVASIKKMDVKRLNKTTNMFRQMSKFSNSIRGDFDKLAEALSDKLLPVLEELKEVMSVIPEKIDVGFQNTSASIAATSAPATTTNVTEQVKRENPNMTPEQIKKVVDNRIAEKSKADANGIGAKLDELMALLRGFGSDNVIVKTL
jgi:hypothetical protein